MFVRILGGFVLLLALLWVVMYATAAAAMRDAKREPWPYGLGTLNELEAHGPRPAASKEAQEIPRLVDALGLDETSPEVYVAAQTAKRDDAIDPPPADAGLAGHEAPLAELVRLVVSAGDGLAWGQVGTPWQLDDAAELLGAAALDRARNGDAAGAWERVHAMWILARSAKGEPAYLGASAALKMEREANAVARKLPAPAPPWLAELTAIEPRRETAALIQQQTLSRVLSMPALPGPFVVFRPISDYIEASNVRRSRAAAEAMTASPRCRMDAAHTLARAEEVYRATRIEAELEATAKMTALKSERARLGHWPPALPDAGASRCADNHWIYETKPDGSSMTLRMSWEVAAEPNVKISPALQFAY
jgi:hypothetical protein